ncbi:FIG004453: protein YceG like [hydrothermal vent metagenome]|uniref:FIG004453: protein YceG like n=1 Tax=hydrothermal vent metagenome TaxID=652676 RepID=A0A3B0WKT2_9ZZZZ
MFTQSNKIFSGKIIGGISIVFFIGLYYSSKIYFEMHKEFSLSEPDSIIFSKGSTIKILANKLIEKKLLDNKNHFFIWGKLNRQETRLQAGEYSLTAGLSLAELLNNMVAGKVIQHNITLIEGYTFRQILQTIQQNSIIDKQLENFSDAEIMTALGHEGEHPEGRFYPDTYYISHGITDADLLKRSYDEMAKILEQEWQQREEGLPLKSAYEALILASIVEKESAIAEERPLIAGLFINRLRKKMRLQTDPTVIYGIENYDGNIRFRDLRKDTPYNTYTRRGLPPTPIALPGREAIHATLHPDKTNYLYFVAYSDGSGRHVFSTNLKDHEKAVDKYQRKKK